MKHDFLCAVFFTLCILTYRLLLPVVVSGPSKGRHSQIQFEASCPTLDSAPGSSSMLSRSYFFKIQCESWKQVVSNISLIFK
jgi:hypothetical protein